MAKGEDLFEDPEQRLVIFDGSDDEQVEDDSGGLGDILVGIVGTFAFALLSNRTFLVRSTVIENAFESRAIDWKMPSNAKTQVPAIARRDKGTVQHYALNARVNATSIHAIGLEQEASAKVLVEALRDKSSVIVHRGNRGIINELLHRHSAVALQMHALGLHRYKSQKEMEEAIKSLVGEWVLFSQCDVHIFRESGWSTTASLLSLHSDRASVFPRIKGKWYTEDLETLCTPDRLIPLDHKAQRWSGI